MHKLSDKDKKLWNFYISNFNSIKKVDKNKKFESNTISVVNKVLKPNFTFTLDSKIKKQIKSNRLSFDAVIDLHGKKEVQAYETIKNFIKDCYFNDLKNIIIVTGKGPKNRGKLKLKTPLWLKSEDLSKYVVGFETMPHNKGGEGALFVRLKSKNKYKL
jgi:dsDNA-specific endonuclease/ATPase MutS2